MPPSHARGSSAVRKHTAGCLRFRIPSSRDADSIGDGDGDGDGDGGRAPPPLM
nr:hypothetical protein GCM10017583_33330 [Agromyces mediolanus]